jgi:hypothetical protein
MIQYLQMRQSLSQRRQAENEVFFRERNERIQKGFDELNDIAKEESGKPYVYDTKTPLQFCCECSDENCRKRVRISLETYNNVHKDRNAFVIICGHEDKNVERIIDKKPEYWVVVKYVNTPKSATSLNKTAVDNS